MRCHYEVLNVSQEADLTEIKSAYRKNALKWHPDKNPDNPDEAKEQFQLVQQAYEVLSDHQERAWYDKHREQILRGANSEFEDKSLDVFQYFTTACFDGYNDDPKGFYTIYRQVFDRLAEEEMEFVENKEAFCDIPRFGDSQSDYDTIVGPFYGYWESFSTRKSYVWLDPYDIREIKDRRYLKLVEKENKKVRAKAKKERNEEIRNLVSFVRRRDKRVQAHTKLVEARIKENRLKQEELSRMRRLERRERLLNDQSEADWSKFENVASELEKIERNLMKEFSDSQSDDECDEYVMDNLYCVACNKIFKTTKAFQNHESSKKHKDNVEAIKRTMLDEEELDLPNGKVTESIEEPHDTTKTKKKKKKKSKNVIKIDDDHSDLDSAETIEIQIDQTVVAENHTETAGVNGITLESVHKDEDDFDFGRTKKTKKKKNTVKTAIAPENKLKRTKKRKDAENGVDVDTDHCCMTCNNTFSSKNKLFEHLKKMNHGIYLPNKTKK